MTFWKAILTFYSEGISASHIDAYYMLVDMGEYRESHSMKARAIRADKETQCGLMDDRTITECNPPVQYPRTDNRCGICGRAIRADKAAES